MALRQSRADSGAVAIYFILFVIIMILYSAMSNDDVGMALYTN